MDTQQYELVLKGCLMVAYGLDLQEKDIDYDDLIEDIKNASSDYLTKEDR